MATLIPKSPHYKHVIRPDGTVRVATTSSISVEPDEIVVEGPVLCLPGQWFYDFKKSKLVEYTKTAKKKREAKKRAAKKVSEAAAASLRGELRAKLGRQPAELQRILEIMAQLSGIQL